MRTLLLFPIACLMLAFAQDGSDLRTMGITNGRFWTQAPDSNKTLYILAIRDSVYYRALTDRLEPDQIPWAKGFQIDDYIKELDLLYKATENIRIPIPFAFAYCTKKLNGQSSKQELENELIRLRALAASTSK